jgi:hypothetical protein
MLAVLTACQRLPIPPHIDSHGELARTAETGIARQFRHHSFRFQSIAQMNVM